ncbi:ATP-binding cassette domain-containing protein [Jonesiaceae bacterium BS-20]|uniref:ATP-binding cassette domain-containing protein n=1 Tax=Jonesiaceae bacterium BS-20 TaxID=3120821 RepID=A0AAU7DYV5_9MICO
MRIVAQGLTHAFAQREPLFTDLSFTAVPGDVIGLVGPSGAGKSTLLSLLAGWLEPTGGTLTRQGIDRLTLVTQNPHGVAGRTALDHVAYPKISQGARRKVANEQAMQFLEKFQLTSVAHTLYGRLSGGERQRMLLARALMGDPQLLLVDEPTAQLDAHSGDVVSKSIARLGAQSAIVFVATHDQRVSNSCTKVLDLLTLELIDQPVAHRLPLLGETH